MNSVFKIIICFAVLFSGSGCRNDKVIGMKAKGIQQEKNLTKKVIIPVDIKYLLYLPQGYNEKGQRWPLIVYLHGAGERGDNLELLKSNGIPKILENKKDLPFVVASPQCPSDTWWLEHIEELRTFIDYIKTEYNIDFSRVYLTGLSMGGFGTWYLAERYPQNFAAIAPICGGGEPAFVMRLKMPVWAFHGAKDDIVSLKRSQDMVDAVKAAGGDVKFTVYPELGHDCWTATYENEELYKWFLKHRKQ